MNLRDVGNGKTVFVDDAGCLINPRDWTKEIFEYIAASEGIKITEMHYEAVDSLRRLNGSSSNLFQIVGELEKIVTYDEFVKLFPEGMKQFLRLSGKKSITGL